VITTDTSLFERAVARVAAQGARPAAEQVRPAAPLPARAPRADLELVTTPQANQAMLASAADVRVGDPRAERDLRGTRQSWQRSAWRLYAELGIVWFAVEYGANALSRHRLIAARQRRPGDEPEPAPVDSFPQQLVDDLSRAVPTPAGMDGNAALMHDLGTNLRCPGECYLLGLDEQGGGFSYDVVSTDEVSLQGGRLIRRRYPGAPPELLPPEALLKRIWKPDAQWSALATSPIKSALADLERLSLLKAGGMAALRSRVALAGLFTLPSELDLPQVDPKNPMPTFDKILLAAMETAVQDAKSVGRFVPLILKGKSDYLRPDVLRKITLYDPEASARDAEEAEAIVRQFAMGIDLPPEVLLGVGDMNHWSAWFMSEQAREAIRPTVELAVAGLTYVYLRPALEAARWPNPEEWVIWFDDSDFGVDRDRVDDANAAVDRGMISAAAYRRATNWQEDDAPSPDEHREWVGIKIGDAGAAMGGPSTGATRSEPAPGAPPLPNGSTGRPPELPALTVPAPPSAITGAAANGGGRAARLRALARQLGAVDRELMVALTVAADRAIQRAAWRAGSKVRSTIRGDGKRATLAALVSRTTNDLLTRELGAVGLATLQIEQDDLFDGIGKAFVSEVRTLVADAQVDAVRRTARALGLSPDEVVRQTATIRTSTLERALAALERGFEQVAVGYVVSGAVPETRGEVSHLIAPRAAIRRAMALAGGSGGSLVGAAAGGGIEASLASGPLVEEVLMSRGAQFGTGFVWDYTGQARTTFSGHLQLDGVEFSGPDDDGLLVDPEDAWLGVTHYKPGDHDGCACLFTPTIEEAGGPTREEVTGEPSPPAKSFDNRDQADAWVSRRFGDWNDRLARDEGLAIDRYRGVMYRSLNEKLRAGAALDDVERGVVNNLERVMANTRTPEPMRVYRGMNHEMGQRIARGEDVVGAIIQDDSFVSTTMLEDVAHGFTGSGKQKLVVQIEVPRGTGVVPVEARQAGEYEMLLPRGQRYRVKSAEFIDTDVRRYSKIVVEMVGG
jgi:ADP-ribosyltransferase exoenzyme